MLLAANSSKNPNKLKVFSAALSANVLGVAVVGSAKLAREGGDACRNGDMKTTEIMIDAWLEMHRHKPRRAQAVRRRRAKLRVIRGGRGK